MDRDRKHLARDQFFQLEADVATPFVRARPVHDHRERVDGIAVQDHVHLHEIGRLVAGQLVVEGGVSAAQRLELVVEVEDDLAERKVVGQVRPVLARVLHAPEDTAPVLRQLHDVAHVLGRDDDLRAHVRLLDRLDLVRGRHQSRVLDDG